jgi:hypothetical protein
MVISIYERGRLVPVETTTKMDEWTYYNLVFNETTEKFDSHLKIRFFKLMTPSTSKGNIRGGANFKEGVVAYYDGNSIKLYPVDEGVSELNAGAYIQEPTKIILHDSSKYIKVFEFDFNQNRWIETAKTYFDAITPDEFKKISDDTYLLKDTVTTSRAYLVKYSNGTINVSDKWIPTNGEATCCDATVDTNTDYADVYYGTYGDITQWGNLKVRLHLPDADDTTNSGVAGVYVYNGTIYIAASDGSALDIALVSLENQKDATVENEIDTEATNVNKVVLVPESENTFAAIVDDVIAVGNLFDENSNLKATNIAVKDITAIPNYVIGIDDDNLYKVNVSDLNNVATKLSDTTVSSLEKVAYVNGAIAVAGITTDSYVAVKFVNPNNIEESLSDWIKVGPYNTGDAIKLTAKGGYLYVDIGSNLYIVDASSVAEPQVLNATLSDIKAFSLFDNIGYGVTSDSKVAKISLENPAQPVVVNKVDLGNYTSETVTKANLYAYGNYVFLNDGSNRVEIYNFANVTNSTAEVKYMGDAEVSNNITSFFVKEINGKYYLISADGKFIHVLNLNPKEVKAQ